MNYIFSFRSRNQSMRFYEMLKRDGIYSKLISTPRAVSIGCGLSVQVREHDLDNAKRVFSFASFDTFLGLFRLDGGRVTRIK